MFDAIQEKLRVAVLLVAFTVLFPPACAGVGLVMGLAGVAVCWGARFFDYSSSENEG